jgi:hypothetical protein
MKLFTYTTTQTALGEEHEFHGPGMPQHANGVHLLQLTNPWAQRCLNDRERGPYEAETILRLLRSAFEAGREDAKREIRSVLGAKSL